MKKIVGMFLIIAVFMAMLFGCTGKNETSTDSDPVTLKLYYWDETFKEVTDRTIEEFNKDNSNIQIESTVIPWAQYWVKMPTLLNSGVDLDMFWCNILNVVEFIEKDLLMEIKQDNITTEDFAAGIIEPFQEDNKLYGMPIFYDPVCMMYNKELFDKAGISYPSDDWTWDDLREAAKELTIRDSSGEAQQWGIYLSGDTWMSFYTFVAQSGSKIYSDDHRSAAFNNADAKTAVQYIYDIMNVDKTSPSIAEGKEFSQDELFASDRVAMIFGTTPNFDTQYKAMGDKVDVVGLPSGKIKATPLSTIAYVASNKTNNPNEVRKFMEFLSTTTANDIMAEKTTPAMADKAEKWLEKYPDTNAKAWLEATKYGFPCPYVKKNNSEVWTIVGTELTNILMDEKSIEQGLADMEKAVNDTQK